MQCASGSSRAPGVACAFWFKPLEWCYMNSSFAHLKTGKVDASGMCKAWRTPHLAQLHEMQVCAIEVLLHNYTMHQHPIVLANYHCTEYSYVNTGCLLLSAGLQLAVSAHCPAYLLYNASLWMTAKALAASALAALLVTQTALYCSGMTRHAVHPLPRS